jgi:arginyl-tRNA synthetase
MKKKIKNEKISKIALEILNKTNESLSIAQITEKLEKEYSLWLRTGRVLRNNKKTWSHGDPIFKNVVDILTKEFMKDRKEMNIWFDEFRKNNELP